MPPQRLVLLHYWIPGRTWEHENCIFHSNGPIGLISSIFWLTTHTCAAAWLPKSCNQCIQLKAVGGVVQDKRSREHCRSWTVLHPQCTSALSSGFHVSQGNAKAQDRWGRKTKHHLISYFLSNTSVKNYRNRMVYVKIIASNRWDLFWDTV